MSVPFGKRNEDMCPNSGYISLCRFLWRTFPPLLRGGGPLAVVGFYIRKNIHMYNSELTPFARELRKNMTEEEGILWHTYLKRYKPRFYRQRVIGDYIVDFYCSAAKLVIELDGSQHYEEDGLENDRIRTEKLEKLGLLVVRIQNNEVKRNLRGVCDYIDRIVAERTPQSLRDSSP